MEKDEETGLSYHNARYYLTWLGRWDKADPIGLGDGLNRFAHVSGNPIRLSDPSGFAGEEQSDSPIFVYDYYSEQFIRQRFSEVIRERGNRVPTSGDPMSRMHIGVSPPSRLGEKGKDLYRESPVVTAYSNLELYGSDKRFFEAAYSLGDLKYTDLAGNQRGFTYGADITLDKRTSGEDTAVHEGIHVLINELDVLTIETKRMIYDYFYDLDITLDVTSPYKGYSGESVSFREAFPTFERSLRANLYTEVTAYFIDDKYTGIGRAVETWEFALPTSLPENRHYVVKAMADLYDSPSFAAQRILLVGVGETSTRPIQLTQEIRSRLLNELTGNAFPESLTDIPFIRDYLIEQNALPPLP